MSVFQLFQFPAVRRPKTLEKHYTGILTSLAMEFMKVKPMINRLQLLRATAKGVICG